MTERRGDVNTQLETRSSTKMKEKGQSNPIKTHSQTGNRGTPKTKSKK